jgi:hypothetical protein
MYDFIYSDKKNILKNTEKFILFVKKLLPKYANSLPDSAVITLYREVKKLKKGKDKLIIETGVGASTIGLFLGAYMFKKKLYTFDINPDKITLLRQVINDAICRPLKININDFWTYVPSNSLDKYTGIPALAELKIKPQLVFLDSFHSMDHLKKEVIEFSKISTKEFVIGMDDGNHTNSKIFPFGYTNMIREKIGLKKIKNPKENISVSFFHGVNELLKKKYKSTKKIKTFYEKNFQNDLWFQYFGADIFYDGLTDRKNVDDFKHVNIFSKLNKKEKESFKSRIVFFSVKK